MLIAYARSLSMSMYCWYCNSFSLLLLYIVLIYPVLDLLLGAVVLLLAVRIALGNRAVRTELLLVVCAVSVPAATVARRAS